MKIEVLKFANILKSTQFLAEHLGYDMNNLDFLSWQETPNGGVEITLAEKDSKKPLTFILPKLKEQQNAPTN